MSEPKTISALLRLGERVLSDSSHIFEDHDNRAEAEELLAFVLGLDDIDEVASDDVPARRDRDRFLSLVARRAGGEPFPFLTGRIEIYGLHLSVKPGSFVPRPSSELMIDIALKRLKRKKHPVVVDVCTGAGPIALAIAHEMPHAEVYGCDIDAGGLAQGRANARELDIPNVTFKKGDLYAPLPARMRGTIDLVTGHVPYVGKDELEDLPSEVREHEPLFTLSDESDDGLGLMRRAVWEATAWLKPGGRLLLEMADDLPKKVKKMAVKAGFGSFDVHSDDDGLSVVLEGRLPKGG